MDTPTPPATPTPEEARKVRRHARNARYWKRHKDKLLAKQRERRRTNPAALEYDRARSRAYYHEHKAERAAYHHRYRLKNAAKLRAYYVAHAKDPKRIANMKRNNALRAERMKTDPEYRAHINAQHREQQRKLRKQPKYASIRYRFYYLKKWAEVVAGGPKRIQVYLRNARPESRRLFMVWYTNNRGLINRSRGLGHIEQARDEEVAS